MTFWRRRHRLRYGLLGLRPFGLFLEVFDTGPASELTPAGRTIRMSRAEFSRRVKAAGARP